MTGTERDFFRAQFAGVGSERVVDERRTDMGKIIVSENVTLDGVIQDPAGAEGFGRGG
jgi:hypothetical protein